LKLEVNFRNVAAFENTVGEGIGAVGRREGGRERER
jgi:hypothetical protein